MKSLHWQMPCNVLYKCAIACLVVFGATAPQWARTSSFTRFLDHTQRRTTVGRIPLEKWSARLRDLYLKIHNTHNRQTSVPPVGFEPITPAGERPQNYVLDRVPTVTGTNVPLQLLIHLLSPLKTQMLKEAYLKKTNAVDTRQTKATMIAMFHHKGIWSRVPRVIDTKADRDNDRLVDWLPGCQLQTDFSLYVLITT